MKTKLILLGIGAACLLTACGNNAAKKDTDTKEQHSPAPALPSGSEPTVEIQTSLGNIKVKLYKDTPQHRDNFVYLVKKGFYDGLLFHRVIQEFMIQGGDPDSKGAPADQRLGNGGTGYNIPAEIVPTYIHKKGALAAARTDNPKKESSGSQFYIVQGHIYTDEELNSIESMNGIKYTPEQRNIYKTLGGAADLDGRYTVFGELIDGIGVLDAIAATPTQANDRPAKDVVIVKAAVIE